MPKIEINFDITNIDDCYFAKLSSNNTVFEVSFSRRYWEVSKHTNDGSQWFSRELTKGDRKYRLNLFKQMFKKHEEVLQRRRDEQSGERAIERKPNRPVVTNRGLKQAIRT